MRLKRRVAAIMAAMLLIVTAVAQNMTQSEKDREAAKLLIQQQTEAARKSFEANIAAAQQKAREREARLATSGPIQRVTIEPMEKPVAPYYNKTADSPFIGNHLEMLERHYPGISTNYTAEQRARKVSVPIIRATLDENGNVVYLSTNAPGTNATATEGRK